MLSSYTIDDSGGKSVAIKTSGYENMEVSWYLVGGISWWYKVATICDSELQNNA
jgi:hypothetical protein